MPLTPDSYTWLAHGSLQTAGCLTVAAEADGELVAAAFGCDPESPTASSYADSEGDIAHGEQAWLGSAGAAVIVVEDNGFQGSRPEVLRAASKASSKGIAASIFWNVEGLVVFSAARRGKLVCSIELLDCDPDDFPGPLRRLARLSGAEDADLIAIGAAMVQQFTGVAYDEQAVRNAVHRTLLPVPDEFTSEGAQWSSLRYAAPELVAAIVAADPQRCRQLAAWAATAAAAEAGVDHETAVRELMTTLGAGGIPTLPAGLGTLLTRWQRDAQQWEKDHPSWDGDDPWRDALEGRFIGGRVAAGQALRLTSHPEPLEAALQATYAAMVAFSSSRTERAGVYVEDERGRHVEYPDLGRPARPRAFIDLAYEAVTRPEPDWDALSSRLPRPFTEAQRQQIIRADQEQQEAGAFDTWQLGNEEPQDRHLVVRVWTE